MKYGNIASAFLITTLILLCTPHPAVSVIDGKIVQLTMYNLPGGRVRCTTKRGKFYAGKY